MIQKSLFLMTFVIMAFLPNSLIAQSTYSSPYGKGGVDKPSPYAGSTASQDENFTLKEYNSGAQIKDAEDKAAQDRANREILQAKQRDEQEKRDAERNHEENMRQADLNRAQRDAEIKSLESSLQEKRLSGSGVTPDTLAPPNPVYSREASDVTTIPPKPLPPRPLPANLPSNGKISQDGKGSDGTSQANAGPGAGDASQGSQYTYTTGMPSCTRITRAQGDQGIGVATGGLGGASTNFTLTNTCSSETFVMWGANDTAGLFSSSALLSQGQSSDVNGVPDGMRLQTATCPAPFVPVTSSGAGWTPFTSGGSYQCRALTAGLSK